MEDRSSARQRQVALKDDTPAILSLILTLGFFGALAAFLRICTLVQRPARPAAAAGLQFCRPLGAH